MYSNMVSVDSPVPLILEERNRDRDIFSLNIHALEYLLSRSNTPLHVISIWGSQSTGKSTLANSVFGFKFPAMSSSSLGQTTRGIDLAFSPELRLLCLDMEASGSSERDGDEGYYIERIVPAFGLAASHLLIFNVRTVREINALSMMMVSYIRLHRNKRKILFCIRDVYQVNNEADLRDKIAQTFDQALRKAGDATKLGEAELNSIFEYDIATVSVYSDEKFENQAAVMQKLRTKVFEMLRDTQPLEVNSIPSIWNQLWKSFYKDVKSQKREEILEKEKNHEFLRVRRVEKTDDRWKNLRLEFASRCSGLLWDIKDNPYRETGIDEVDREFKSKIDQLYQNDPYSKETVLSLYREEYLTQAMHLEIYKFRYSIINFFKDISQNSHNLYSKFISMFETLDLQDEDRHRVIHAIYIDFLQQTASNKNSYYSTIRKSLQDVYDHAYTRITTYESYRMNQSQKSVTRQRILQSELHQLFDSVSKELKAEITETIINIYSKRLVRAVARATVCTVIGGSTWCNFGVVAVAATAGICIGIEAFWSRKSVWRSLAETSATSIQDSQSLKYFYSKLEELLQNRELFLS